MAASNLITKAVLAQKAERYEDLTETMKKYIIEQEVLSDTQRDLFIQGYQNLAEKKLKSWKYLYSQDFKQRRQGKEGQQLVLLTEYIKEVGDELCGICKEAIKLIDEVLLSALEREATNTGDGKEVETVKSQVFYQKMKGDFYCYMYKVNTTGALATEVKALAENAYTSATDLAKKHLGVCDVLRLGVALSYSVFIGEILEDPNTAYKVALKAFSDALTILDDLDDEQYRDTTAVLQNLRDKFVLWMGDNDEDEYYSK